MKKITLRMVADAAKVGSATAERVLNGRGGVRPELVERVLHAARKLDYPKRLPEQHRGVTRIEVLMTRPDLSFLARLSQSFARIAASLDSSISLHRTFFEENNPAALAAHILSPPARRSALIVVLPEHPMVSAALEQARKAGLIVVQLVSRFAGLNAPYVGIDNEAAGRMAGLLMAGLQRKPGFILSLCHSQLYAVHRERIRGFSDYMLRQKNNGPSLHQTAFTFDDEKLAAKIVADLVPRLPGLVGIYSAGGDYGPLCQVLEKLKDHNDICFIGHELTTESEKALRRGTMQAVIDQAPETQARRALDTALFHLGMLATPVDPSPIRFITITGENL